MVFLLPQANTANRSLTLGGIAIIWCLKTGKRTYWAQSDELPQFFLALALNLLQYFIGGLAGTGFTNTNTGMG